jgi:hypothetical protein
MGDAAQGEPRKHEVFSTPFKVTPKFETWKTPGNYRRYPDGDKLPNKIKVWRVQNTGKKGVGGVVSRSYGFEDSPDAEILTAGFNTGKEPGAVGVGRHGSVLQWGFSAPPSKMTEPGRRFFLNCVVYIRKFDGVRPLVTCQRSHRTNAIWLAALLNVVKEPKWHASYHPADLMAKYKGDPDGLVKYYRDNFELIYRPRRFQVDAELKGLGITSNRQVDTLEKLVEMLSEPDKAKLALKLLRRYTDEKYTTAKEYRAWLSQSRGRIYFTDVGGYKFRVVPKGYPAVRMGKEASTRPREKK